MSFGNKNNDNWYKYDPYASDDKKNGGFDPSRGSAERDPWETEDSQKDTRPPQSAESPFSNDRHSSDSAGFSEGHAYSSPYWTESEARESRHSATKIAIISISAIVLLLLAGIFYTIFFRIDWDDAQSAIDGREPDISGALNPYQDNYQDFFNQFYTDDTTTGQNSIERAPTGTGVTLEITQNPGTLLTLQEIYQKCAPSVVGITAGVEGSNYYWGTGIIFSADGYIVTNYHVLAGTDSATVSLFDGSEYEALMVGYDTQSDLAVLKIDAAGLSCAEFGSSDSLLVGDDVVAIGNPLGKELQGTMTNGIISAINRDIEYGGHVMTLLQTNAAINEGNSGGPLINMRGQIIGITNMKMISAYSSIEGIGFAIPSATIKSVVDQLIESGYVAGRPALGITVGSVPSSAASYYDLPDGLYISKIEEGSGADKAGLKPGDIVTAANGQPVTTTAELNAIKDSLAIGDTLTLTIYRNGETFEAEIELMEMSLLYS